MICNPFLKPLKGLNRPWIPDLFSHIFSIVYLFSLYFVPFVFGFSDEPLLKFYQNFLTYLYGFYVLIIVFITFEFIWTVNWMGSFTKRRIKYWNKGEYHFKSRKIDAIIYCISVINSKWIYNYENNTSGYCWEYIICQIPQSSHAVLTTREESIIWMQNLADDKPQHTCLNNL